MANERDPADTRAADELIRAADQQAPGPGQEIRASDQERDEIVARLSDACAEGRLTLEELTERTEQALGARTRRELARLAEDLPAVRAGGPPAPPEVPESRIVAVVGDVVRAGSWSAERNLNVVAVLGDVKLDLRQAHVPRDGVTITATAVVGDVTILVPEGVRVRLTGSAALGDKTLDVVSPPPGIPAPTVHVRGHAVVGDIHVSNTPRRGVLQRILGSG